MNKDNIIMQEGISFLKLIKDKKILVPKIQRDFAQGRLDNKASEIRDNFLTSIFNILTTNDNAYLLLDFIYGSTHDEVFTPLDGQQRLTTLFLLHWYFIPQNKKSVLYKLEGNSCYSRFSYETRISSKDFSNELVTHSCKELKSLLIADNTINNLTQRTLSDIIKNQSWFLWSWRKDPTIKAMLVMLDEIEKRTAHMDEIEYDEIWKKLENGKILFHLLPLEQFSLTNELYVKMNARGKELSEFDVFKSTLEEQMCLNNVNDDIQRKWRENIDSNWIDLFWNKLAKPYITDSTKSDEAITKVNSVENGYLRFFKRMMEYHLFLRDNSIVADINDENIKQYIPFEIEESNYLNKIREFSVRNEILLLIHLFNKTNFFNNDFFLFNINFFNSFIFEPDGTKQDGAELITGVSFENKKNLFEAFIGESIDYETRVQFFAIIKFFEFNTAQKVYKDELLKKEFNSWMRIIRNLTTNTNTNFYNGYDDFLKSLKSIEVWSSSVYSKNGSGSIIEYFKHQSILDGFNGDQLKEEVLKANLMENNDWKTEILEAEEHPYFLGQIRFLFEWSKNEDKYDISLFKMYKNQVFTMFDQDGLRSELSENHRFRNAIMTISDWYLLDDCFVQNTRKDRKLSWKRYLRESDKSKNIKLLIDQYQNKGMLFKDFCDEQKRKLPTDWRKFFIERPEIYDELFEHKISYWNWDAGEICLLSKTRWSSRHKELKTFYLYLTFKNNGDLYLDSTHDSNSYCAVFKRDNGKEFSVQFIPKWDDEWVEGQYIINANFDSKNVIMQKSKTNNEWKLLVNSLQSEDLEEIVKSLNQEVNLIQ